MNDKTTIHLEDFILDNSFKEYVTGENKESVDKWKEWIRLHPQASKEVENAEKILNVLLKTRKQVPKLHTEEEFNKLLFTLKNENSIEKPSRSFLWVRVAAISVILISVSTIIYFSLKKSTHKEIVYNQVIVPLGEKSQVILSDGTHIWINSSSKLKYPVNFDENERIVYLEGEAFFDVKKSNNQSFIVNTPDLKIRVLGTAFNVKNYPGDKNAITTVLKGLVSVENKNEQTNAFLLKPNENLVVSTLPALEKPSQNNVIADDEKVIVPTPIKPIINKKVNVEAITSWKDQMLVFSDESLEEVALKMERWYNVKIHILDEDLKKERYRGKFVNNETIYQVFEAIKITTPIMYYFKDNEFYINKPK